MKNKSLYVITHKEVKNAYPKDRKIMLVGAKGKVVPEGYFSDYDKNKDNISEKNSTFCELTGQYYFIKNDSDADVFGLEHYRRLFTKRKIYLFKFPFLKSKDIDKILSEYDIIVPKITKLDKSVYENYYEYHVGSDLDRTLEIINKKYPEYADVCKDVINGNETYFCNMFIAKREVIENYSKWLFDILFEVEPIINDEVFLRQDYNKRAYGYLAERLFTVWLFKNSDIKRYECKVEFLRSNNPFINMCKKVIHLFKRILKIDK